MYTTNINSKTIMHDVCGHECYESMYIITEANSKYPYLNKEMKWNFEN